MLGHPRELGHRVPGSAAVLLPSPARPSVTHGTSLSLIALPGTGLGAPACRPTGAAAGSGWEQLSHEREKKKSFLRP